MIYKEHVNPFYVLLFNLSEELNIQELQSLSFLYGKVPKRENINIGIDLFSIMLQHVNLSPTKLDSLESMLANINRNDLVQEIKDFANRFVKQGKYVWSNTEVSSMEIYGSDESIQNTNQDKEHQFRESPVYDAMRENYHYEEVMDQDPVLESVQSSENETVSLKHINIENQQELEDVTEFSKLTTISTENEQFSLRNINMEFQQEPEDVAEFYKMTANPRGLCLIIDNQIFTYNPGDLEATQLGNRVGSEKDCDALRETFQDKLHFQMQIEKNKTDFEIAEIIKRVSLLDHRKFDCFVCCILTHGGEGFVFGTNGRKFSIKEIIKTFSAQSCPSLAGKPKLFFLQSCRGKRHQLAFPTSAMLEIDAPQVEPDDDDLLPPEADFLLGYATVADAVSYRSRSHGTFYVNELTKALNSYADRFDLLRILTKVNNEVSKRVYTEGSGEERIVYKQIPAPQYTLRKVLKFLSKMKQSKSFSGF
ncbi:hypothetical protein Btru_020687 [Bulinus truncatus]|nr:hypothetical protein Btru_020687 [Bulinus truncatus]